jgi:hypothetical protein
MPGVARSTVAGSNRKALLHITKKGKKEYEYVFDDMEFILDGPVGVVSFAMEPIVHGSHAKPKQAYIRDYCTTQPGKVEALDPRNHSQVLQAPFGAGTTAVDFRVRLDEHEMLLIGLIVAVEEDGELVHMICDPQVGNGPPVNPSMYAMNAPTAMNAPDASRFRPAFIIE